MRGLRKYVIIPLMLQIPKKLFELKYLLIAMAVLMLLSLSVHALIPHDHPQEIFGTGMQAALHGNDKKWWILLLLAALLVLFRNSIKNDLDNNRQILARRSFWLTSNLSNIFDPIREALRRGILNPKLCE